jgi:cardiolipin synthase
VSTARPINPGWVDEDRLDRVVTLPNAVTAVRLLAIPLFVWLLFGAGRQSAAAAVLALLGATDWVDGFLARRLHQVSTVGKVLDPAADRLLIVTGVVAIVVHGAVPVWFAVATLSREVVVGGAVLALAALGAARIDVLRTGKAGTFGLMVAYPTFLLSHGTAGWQVPVHDFAWVTGGIGLVLAWVAALSYVGPGRRALAAGRAGRRAVAVTGQGAEPDTAVPDTPARDTTVRDTTVRDTTEVGA